MNASRPGFYLTFWQLSTYDLSPPMAKYDEEGAALRALSRQEDSRYVAADRSADRQKRLTAAAHRSKRDRYNQLVNTLNRELKQQIISREYTQKRLAQEKQYWFAHCKFMVVGCVFQLVSSSNSVKQTKSCSCGSNVRALHLPTLPIVSHGC